MMTVLQYVLYSTGTISIRNIDGRPPAKIVDVAPGRLSSAHAISLERKTTFGEKGKGYPIAIHL